ncbi:hypothetical protein MTX26_17355 [Bradyrhizobium sp. ISRA443]|uniref:hypothetical protein n=1 Tax=unclassified Bradyrhizobium TaxID=2631580 RepID=UPI00247A8006|nr:MULTISPECIES: hypothetical protein [unclassified Bradyrhizobium]WGR92045.1 hypothetical protein MTX20_27955 [Bradyrhizobium sp. ISRA435]WGS02485.1 hypothetical protein MTX23_17365 [Bradyrhizobium sp. ISRA436]WGS09370.1 hypothetical protein MTX18_17355 [Bradyrhizobium sp. ISRA437]WGS16259.1 hypothetical protein MTX26_17355 [Bradyrhizobium sp. ISRA443]
MLAAILRDAECNTDRRPIFGRRFAVRRSGIRPSTGRDTGAVIASLSGIDRLLTSLVLAAVAENIRAGFQYQCR